MSAKRSVYLTFDDGPHPVHTPAVLETLARHRAAATFFVVGRETARHPELVSRIDAEGHGVGNHTWSHPDLSTLSQEDGMAELRSASEAIERVLGAAPVLFRPPYGRTSETTRADAAAAGMETVLWDIDPNDWDCPGEDTIVERVVSSAADRSRSIVLLHDGGGDRSQTVAALDMILQTLAARGFDFPPLASSIPAGDHSAQLQS